MPTINIPISDSFILRDNGNAAITGKVSGDFSVIEAYALPGAAATAGVTLTEIGDGEYAITFTPSITGAWAAHVVYNSGGVFREFSGSYVVVTAAQADPAAALASATVTLVSPVTVSGDMTVMPGFDYLAADGRAPSWSTTDPGAWPDLTDAAITWETSAGIGDIAGEVVQATGATKQVRIELTRTQTAALTAWQQAGFLVSATLASGAKVPLVQGKLIVAPRTP